MQCFTVDSDLVMIGEKKERIAITRLPYPCISLAGQRRVGIGRKEEQQIIREIDGVECVTDVGFMPLKNGGEVTGHMIVAPLPNYRLCDRILVLWRVRIDDWKLDHTHRVRKDTGSDDVVVPDVGSKYVNDGQNGSHLLLNALTVLHTGDMVVLWTESQRYPKALKYAGRKRFILISDPYDQWEQEEPQYLNDEDDRTVTVPSQWLYPY